MKAAIQKVADNFVPADAQAGNASARTRATAETVMETKAAAAAPFRENGRRLCLRIMLDMMAMLIVPIAPIVQACIAAACEKRSGFKTYRPSRMKPTTIQP